MDGVVAGDTQHIIHQPSPPFFGATIEEGPRRAPAKNEELISSDRLILDRKFDP